MRGYYDECTDNYVRTETQEQKNYLDNRLNSTSCEQQTKAHEKYHMSDDGPPRNPKELVERILAGKYILPKDKDGSDITYDWKFNTMIWRDPAAKKDAAGYTAAMAAIDTAFTSVKDKIEIDTPANALAAIEAFAKQEF